LRSVGSTCLRPRVPKSGFFFLPTPICISPIRPRYLTFEPRGRFCTRRHVCDHSLLARRCATRCTGPSYRLFILLCYASRSSR
jgi:hypothetical protein